MLTLSFNLKAFDDYNHNNYVTLHQHIGSDYGECCSDSHPVSDPGQKSDYVNSPVMAEVVYLKVQFSI